MLIFINLFEPSAKQHKIYINLTINLLLISFISSEEHKEKLIRLRCFVEQF